MIFPFVYHASLTKSVTNSQSSIDDSSSATNTRLERRKFRIIQRSSPRAINRPSLPCREERDLLSTFILSKAITSARGERSVSFEDDFRRSLPGSDLSDNRFRRGVRHFRWLCLERKRLVRDRIRFLVAAGHTASRPLAASNPRCFTIRVSY